MKTVLIIAGSDPGAGAGLQQDLKVATLMGAYGLTVVTALTIQNSQGVQAVHPVAPEVVAAQLDAVLSDFPVDAIKVGMLATPDIVRLVAARLRALDTVPLVLDPVLAAGGGFPLLDEAGIDRSERRVVSFDLSSHSQRPGSRPLNRNRDPDPRRPGRGGPSPSSPGASLGPGQGRPPAGGPGGRAHRRQRTPITCPGCALPHRITTAPAACWPPPARRAWPRACPCPKP